MSKCPRCNGDSRAPLHKPGCPKEIKAPYVTRNDVGKAIDIIRHFAGRPPRPVELDIETEDTLALTAVITFGKADVGSGLSLNCATERTILRYLNEMW